VSLVDWSRALLMGTLLVYLLIQVGSLIVSLRHRKADVQLSIPVRLIWTMVPLVVVALLVGALVKDGWLQL
jgi:hypothetical protein